MVTTTAPRPVAVLSPSALRLLRTAGFVSNFDRFCIAPMPALIGSGLGVPVATVVLAASGYYLAYGLMQPVWGAAGDRWGRVRVMRVSLAGAAPAALLSALAPDAPVLIAARVLTGACFAAAIAASLTYVGDTVPAEVRQRPLSELMTAFALGTALATGVAGALAHYAGWRPVFALPGVLAGFLALALRRLPEPARPRSGSLLAPFGTVLRSRRQWYVMAVALLEGAVLLGFLTYLAPALEAHGVPVAVAGAVAALYGVGTMAASRAVTRLVGRWSPAALIVAGGTQTALAYLLAGYRQSTGTLVVAAVLLGGGWSFLHSTVQTWATTVCPTARSTAVALFGVALYGGGALSGGLAAATAQAGAYRPLFWLAALLSVPLTVAAAVGRARCR
ncbi:MFS transporter [Streptomyces misionensis]|uniref:MFS transporter n=1 Tax=Streptomyces misionensis TaxID=67331 RepID=UPI0021BD0956|nr:MFS transporter [Streptomyces misionensis]